MCRITDKLILCSCDSGLDLHGNHWILNRFQNGKEETIIGQPMLPYDGDPEIESYNVKLIEEMINQGDCFDFETEFQEKDQLILFFKNDDQYQEERIYAFEFSEKKWCAIETEHLMLTWYHDTIRKGLILKIRSNTQYKQKSSPPMSYLVPSFYRYFEYRLQMLRNSRKNFRM